MIALLLLRRVSSNFSFICFHCKALPHTHLYSTPFSFSSSNSGHPLCQFCNTRHFDNDHLNRHLHQHHVLCTLCDRMGVRNQFCVDQPALHEHYLTHHLTCEYLECKHLAFADEFELRAHQAKEHVQSAQRSKVNLV